MATLECILRSFCASYLQIFLLDSFYLIMSNLTVTTTIDPVNFLISVSYTLVQKSMTLQQKEWIKIENSKLKLKYETALQIAYTQTSENNTKTSGDH